MCKSTRDKEIPTIVWNALYQKADQNIKHFFGNFNKLKKIIVQYLTQNFNLCQKRAKLASKKSNLVNL